MKKNYLQIAVVVLLLVLTACGGDGDKRTEEDTSQDIVLDFGTEGDYDLSEYAMPDTNRSNTYKEKVYFDKSGTRNYVDANESYFAYKYYVKEKEIEELKENRLIRTLNIYQDRLMERTIENNTTIKSVRYINIGEFIVKHDYLHTEQGKSKEVHKLCKVDRHMPERNNYEDILLISCDLNESVSIDFEGSQTRKETSGTYQAYIARHTGVIESTEDFCTTLYLDDTKVKKECKKKEVELLLEVEI